MEDLGSKRFACVRYPIIERFAIARAAGNIGFLLGENVDPVTGVCEAAPPRS
jgi:hypothetical protein